VKSRKTNQTKEEINFNKIVQVVLPILTLSSQIAITLKYPEWGLIINLFVQPFWIYSAWKAYKEAGQIGLFITTILFAILVVIGIVNYWIL